MARDDSESLLSVAQAAALLGVHPNTIRTWTDAGRLGAFRINSRGDRRYRRGDVERLLVEDGVAIVAGTAAAVQREAEAALMARLSRGFATTLTEPSVARTLVESLRSEAGIGRVAVYIADDDQLRLEAHAGFARPPAGATGADGRTDDPTLRALPLVTRRGRFGLLLVDAPRDDASSRLLDAAAAAGGAALQTARMLSRARRELQRARTLRRVTKELTSTLDLEAVLGDAIGQTRALFEADMAGLWLIDRGARHPFRIAAEHGLTEEFVALVGTLTMDDPTIGARAAREARSVWSNQVVDAEQSGPMHAAYAASGITTACLVPLVARDEVVGVLGLYHRRRRAWSEASLDLVQAFADQAAIAIQNARLYHSVADQAVRLRSIQDLSARLNRLTDVRAIGEAIVAEASALAEYHDIRIYRVDREAGTCEPIAFTREMLEGDPADAETLLRVDIGEGFTGWVAEHGQPLLINDAVDDPRGKTIEGTDDVPESMLVVPMLYEGQAVGVIVLSQLGLDRFSEDDLQTMVIFAGYAAQAMANAETYGQLVAQSGELARRVDSQRRMMEINERLLATLDQEGVLETIADGLRDVVDYDNLSIFRIDPGHTEMRAVLTRERHAAEVRDFAVPYGKGLMGWAVSHAEPVLANDALADPRALQVPGTPNDPEAVVVVPLVAAGEVLGAMNVSRVGGAEVHFSQSDFELIQLFAGQASVALRNADAHHAMRELALTDALTGLRNHGAFQRDLAAAVEAATSAGSGRAARLAVLMMDLDSFKAYNDRHLHTAGDELLVSVAGAIYGAARSEDRIYRYGGDEFALILAGASTGEAARVGERIRRAVAALTVDDPTPVTITVGVSGLPDDAVDRDSLIRAADTALFYGKRAGENRVVRADRMPPDVVELRGTLEDLASAALRESDDVGHSVEHLVERASQLGGHAHELAGSLRDALLIVSRSFDTQGHTARGHTDRVGRLAVTLAGALGLPENERRDVELAARLHTLDDRGVAELGKIPSLHAAAALIVGQRALAAEGGRRGRRASRAHGRVATHVVGVANAYDELVSGMSGPRLGRSEALACLRDAPATYRGDVLDALAQTVGQRRDVGRRRRAADAPQEARGAA